VDSYPQQGLTDREGRHLGSTAARADPARADNGKWLKRTRPRRDWPARLLRLTMTSRFENASGRHAVNGNWGKKDPSRLAFEDSTATSRITSHRRDARTTQRTKRPARTGSSEARVRLEEYFFNVGASPGEGLPPSEAGGARRSYESMADAVTGTTGSTADAARYASQDEAARRTPRKDRSVEESTCVDAPPASRLASTTSDAVRGGAGPRRR